MKSRAALVVRVRETPRVPTENARKIIIPEDNTHAARQILFRQRVGWRAFGMMKLQTVSAPRTRKHITTTGHSPGAARRRGDTSLTPCVPRSFRGRAGGFIRLRGVRTANVIPLKIQTLNYYTSADEIVSFFNRFTQINGTRRRRHSLCEICFASKNRSRRRSAIRCLPAPRVRNI